MRLYWSAVMCLHMRVRWRSWNRPALVSRLHCRITASADKLEVVDLKSTNGTFVNGKRVAKAQVADGDTLRVGRVELTIAKK